MSEKQENTEQIKNHVHAAMPVDLTRKTVRTKPKSKKHKKTIGSKSTPLQKWEKIDDIDFLVREIQKIKQMEKF